MTKDLLAVKIMFLTGLRPLELAHGVELLWLHSWVGIRINGIKVDDEKGQPWRVIWYPVMVLPMASTQSQVSLSLYKQRKILRTYYGLKPYDLRRNFARYLKMTGWKASSIAMALGHSGVCSLRFYVWGQAFPIGADPIHVHAPYVVKQHRRTKRNHQYFRPNFGG